MSPDTLTLSSHPPPSPPSPNGHISNPSPPDGSKSASANVDTGRTREQGHTEDAASPSSPSRTTSSSSHLTVKAALPSPALNDSPAPATSGAPSQLAPVSPPAGEDGTGEGKPDGLEGLQAASSAAPAAADQGGKADNAGKADGLLPSLAGLSLSTDPTTSSQPPPPRSPSLHSPSASPSLPPRRASRPPSASLSRPPSSYRPRSASSVSRLSASLNASLSSPQDPKRLSVSASQSLSAGPSSPVIPEHPGAPEPWDRPVVVRDYAFERADPRFEGRSVPDEQRFRDSRDASRRSSRWDLEEDEAEGEGGRGSGFSWGFVTTHDPASASPFAGSPSQAQFPSSSQFSSFPSQAFSTSSFGYDDAAEEDYPEEEELGEFVPGVYAALYPFEPELETEMRLEVGELVSVWERQCAGWVQASRIRPLPASTSPPGSPSSPSHPISPTSPHGALPQYELTGEVGLVPENYVELVHATEGIVNWGSEGDLAKEHEDSRGEVRDGNTE
ncbi:hypothetical protein JCM10213_003757 [Rhodosporidiobolus nylandii]